MEAPRWDGIVEESRTPNGGRGWREGLGAGVGTLGSLEKRMVDSVAVQFRDWNRGQGGVWSELGGKGGGVWGGGSGD